MDKKFIENCKLLKEHFIQSTQTDTAIQSSEKPKNSAEEIIHEAKTVLFNEQLEALCDKDIEQLRKNSVLQYANALDESKNKSHKLCKNNHVRWNDEIFTNPLPNPRKNYENVTIRKKPNKNNDKLQNIVVQDYDMRTTEGKKRDDYKENPQKNHENITIRKKPNKNNDKLQNIVVQDYDMRTTEGKRLDDYKENPQKNHENITIRKKPNKNNDKLQNIVVQDYDMRTTEGKRLDDYKENPQKNHENITIRKKPNKNNDKLQNIVVQDYDMRTTEGKRLDDYKENPQKNHENITIRKKPNKNNDKLQNIVVQDYDMTTTEGKKLDDYKENVNSCNKIAEQETEIAENVKHEIQKEKINIENKTPKIKDIPELKIVSQQNNDTKKLLNISKIPIKNFKNVNFDCTENTNSNEENKDETELNKNTKIDVFLDHLQQYKSNIAIKSKSDLAIKENKQIDSKTIKIKPKSSNYKENKYCLHENRLKAQKDIIQMQKEKLAEQTHIIKELKINQIHKDVKESLHKARNEYQETVSLIPRYKYKFKSDQKKNTTANNTDPNGLSLSLKLSKAPKGVRLMAERQREREEKRLLIKERRRLIEEEKKKQAEEAIARKLKEEIKEKQSRLGNLKRQREIARQTELKKQLEKERFVAINQMAIAHYKKLLKRKVFQHFKKLIFHAKLQMAYGQQFYTHNIVSKHFCAWNQLTTKIMTKKIARANKYYSKKLLVKTMQEFKKMALNRRRNKQVAIDRYNMVLQSNCFISWHRLVSEYRIQYKIKIQMADLHYRRVLLVQCLHAWLTFPAVMKIERTKNERRRKWRLRVAEILTDYDPTKNYIDS